MKTWMKSEEFVPFAPDSPGTVHIHHCKSGHGNDKLYITRKEDGTTILAHCFHCGQRGYHSVVSSGKISRASRVSTYEALDSYGSYSADTSIDSGGEDVDRNFREARSSDHRRDLTLWPLPAKKWWLECGLSIPEQEGFGVTYNDLKNTVDMPLWDGPVVTGMCQRTLTGGEYIPKYILVGQRVSGIITHPSNSYDNRTLIIVEDMRSAYKLSRYVATYPLLGTELERLQLIKILEAKCSNVLIYLDNDNEMVRKKSRAMKKRLDIYMPCDIISREQDPKTLNDIEIKELLK